MTPEEFAATRLWCSNHFNIDTFVPLATAADELAITSRDGVTLWNPTSFRAGLEEWFDKAQQLGTDGVFLTAKHWDGFCLWPSEVSPRNVTAAPWYSLFGGLDPVAEFVALARAYGMHVGFYFCVRDGYYQASGVGTGGYTYTAWTTALLTELLSNYGNLDYLFLDGWGDFWEAGGGPGFGTVDYQTVMDLVAELQGAIAITVNNHEAAESADLHGNVGTAERPVDGELSPGLTAFPAYAIHDPWHINSKWFRHVDSTADTATEAQLAIGRMFRAWRDGPYVCMGNFSCDPAGTLGSDVVAMLDKVVTLDRPPAITENFALAATEAAPVNLQAHAAWSKSFGTGNAIINYSGRVHTTDGVGVVYRRNDLSLTGGRVNVRFSLKSLPTNMSVTAMLNANAGATNDDRFTLAKVGSNYTVTLSVNNSGLTQLSTAAFTESLVVDHNYMLTLEKVANNLVGSVWIELHGRLTLWGRLFGSSGTNSSGNAAFGLADSTGSVSAGIHLTGFEVCEIDATAPLSPTLRVVNNETVGVHLAIDSFNPTILTKVYRSQDNALTWELVGCPDCATFVDAELGSGTALYKAVGISPSWLASAYSNTVRMTGAAGSVGTLVRDNLDAKISEAGGGGGGPVLQRTPAASRVLQVRDRGDGTYGVVGSGIRAIAGEPKQLWALEFKGTQLGPGQLLYGMTAPELQGTDLAHATVGSVAGTDYGACLTQARFDFSLTSSATEEDDITVKVRVTFSAAADGMDVYVPVSVKEAGS